MKKILCIFSVFLLVLCPFVSFGCGAKETTYTLSYNINGGVGSIENQSIKQGESVVLSSGEGLSKTGSTLYSWNTKADGTGTRCKLGSNLNGIERDVELFAVWGTYERVEENGKSSLYFGRYPQKEVTENALKTALGNFDENTWTSYGYYQNGTANNFMYYLDKEYDGAKYRGVYFSSYRPTVTDFGGLEDNSYQKENGYTASKVYWFKYDFIKWSILNEESGAALLFCQIGLDSQPYQNTYSSTVISQDETVFFNNGDGVPAGTYANNYQYSTIRKWLNDTFYNTAFNDLQKGIIQITAVDNSAASTNPFDRPTGIHNGVNDYACANTQDKLFLLSISEITNSNFNYINLDLKATDYAKAQGCLVHKDKNGISNEWSRSPYFGNSFYVNYRSSGLNLQTSFANTFFAVCPALRVSL